MHSRSQWKHIMIEGAQGLPLEIGVPFFVADSPEYDNWTVVHWEKDRRLDTQRTKDTRRELEIMALDYHTGDLGPHAWGLQRDALCIDLGQWRGMAHALSLLGSSFIDPSIGAGAAWNGLVIIMRHLDRVTTDSDREAVARALACYSKTLKDGQQ